jgi:hypothetical protein
MPRSGRIRTFIKEYSESSTNEKLSFIPPFLILVIEIILFTYAYIHDEFGVMTLTSVLLIVSIIEAIFVTREMHDHYLRNNYDKILTIKLDDFITQNRQRNLKKIVADFIMKYPEYYNSRTTIYHTACQILETHMEEKWDEDLSNKLRRFIKRKKKANVDDIVEEFVGKYKVYKKNRAQVYEKTCQIMDDTYH